MFAAVQAIDVELHVLAVGTVDRQAVVDALAAFALVGSEVVFIVCVKRFPVVIGHVCFIVVVALGQRERHAAFFKDRKHIVRSEEAVLFCFFLVFALEAEGDHALPDAEVVLEIARAEIFNKVAGENDQIGLCGLDRFFKEGPELVGRVLVVLGIRQVQNGEFSVFAEFQLRRSGLLRGKAENGAGRQQKQQAKQKGD